MIPQALRQYIWFAESLYAAYVVHLIAPTAQIRDPKLFTFFG